MITLHEDYLFQDFLGELIGRFWRGEAVTEEEYLEEAWMYGPDAVVHVFATKYAILRVRSQIDSRDCPPSEAEYLEHLRELLGEFYNEGHTDLFHDIQREDPLPPVDAGFRPGDPVTIGGSPAVLRRWLGSGGQGEVWAASLLGPHGKPESGTIAIKFEHLQNGPGSTKRAEGVGADLPWQRRLCFLPGIALSWEDKLANGRGIACTEQIDGESLRERLRVREEFPPRDAARIVERVATTLGSLHALGISHQDIKSANIILDRSDSPWLIDFDLASSIGEGEGGRGTQLYAAPELSRSQPQADVFGLGTVLFELLAGRPWGSWEDRVDALAHASPAAGLPDQLRAILRRCLSPRPEDRYAHAMDLATSLREYLINDRVPSGGPAGRRPGPVAILAEKSLPERGTLARDPARCLEAISAGLRQRGIPEGQFREATEALLGVVNSGVARRIAETPSGVLSLVQLMSETPEARGFWGNAGWWAIEEWGWLLGKAWSEDPALTLSPLHWLYSSTIAAVVGFCQELGRDTGGDPARRFRLRYQTVKAFGWLAWMEAEKMGAWELAVTHREQAEHIARELGASSLVVETRLHLAKVLLQKPVSRNADLTRAAELLDSINPDDCDHEYLRQRQFLRAQIHLRRGNFDTAVHHVRVLLREISQDDPERERWLTGATSLFGNANAFNDARACLLERLARARARNERGAEWSIRADIASVDQLSGEAGWEDCFAQLIAESESTPDVQVLIWLVASKAYFNAGRLVQAVNMAIRAREIQQQRGNFRGVGKTEALLAKYLDRPDYLVHSCRFAILAALTAVFNGSLSGLDEVRSGLQCWDQFPEEQRTLNNLLIHLKGQGKPQDFDSHYSAVVAMIENTELLTDQDKEWLKARQEK